MTQGLRVVGAGLGRTGTLSLKLALERLLGAPCYHMREVLAHPDHVRVWHGAVLGVLPDWREFFANYAAAVDSPVAYFWEELTAAFPEALVLLSVRDSEDWWRSASETIYHADRLPRTPEWLAMRQALYTSRWIADVKDREPAIRAFEAHNARVCESVPADRLLIWRPGDGWESICSALALPIPDAPFPHANTRAEWQARNRMQRHG
jgi:hypothetical protein